MQSKNETDKVTMKALRKIQILTAIIALLLTVPLCWDMVSGFVLGFETPEIGEHLTYKGYPIGVEVIPDGVSSIQAINSTDGMLGSIDFKREMLLFIPIEKVSTGINIVTAILSFIAIVCAIYFIVYMVKLATTLARQGIMNNVALKQLRKVSYSMLAAYILFTITTILPTWYYSQHLDLIGYSMTYPRMSQGIVIAIIFILISEILNITLRLKEEQDLTI